MAKPKRGKRGANIQRRRDEIIGNGKVYMLYRSEDTERSEALFRALIDTWPWIAGAAYCGYMENGGSKNFGSVGALVIDNSADGGAGDFGLPARGAVPAIYLSFSDAMAAADGLYFDDGGVQWPEADRLSINMQSYDPGIQTVVAVRYGPGDCVHFVLEFVGTVNLWPPYFYHDNKSGFDNRHDKPAFWFAKVPNSEHYALTVSESEYRAYLKNRGKGIV